MDYHNRNLMSSLIIQQEVYSAPQPYERLPNFEFTVRGVLGVRLVDALNPAFNGFDNPDFVPRMSREAKKITLRLKVSKTSVSFPCPLAYCIQQWPGYSEWKEVVHVFDHTYNVNPNTTRKVAQIVAQKVKTFWNVSCLD